MHTLIFCRTLPSMPMSRRLDVSCPQFLWACCLLIQFQLNPRKSRTILFPTVSFNVCCRYTLEMHNRKKVCIIYDMVFYTGPTTGMLAYDICWFPRKLHIYMTWKDLDNVNPNIYSVSKVLDVSEFFQR